PAVSTNAEREECPFVLERSECTLHPVPLCIQVVVPLGFTRDQRAKPGGFDPHGLRFALAGGAPPFGRAAGVVGSGECPLAVYAVRRSVLSGAPALVEATLGERDHGGDLPLFALRVDHGRVVALV